VNGALPAGASSASVAANADSSRSAAGASTPSFRRANIQSQEAFSRLDRGRSSGCIISGTHASARNPV
jgi:hypothetical protein